MALKSKNVLILSEKIDIEATPFPEWLAAKQIDFVFGGAGCCEYLTNLFDPLRTGKPISLHFLYIHGGTLSRHLQILGQSLRLLV